LFVVEISKVQHSGLYPDRILNFEDGRKPIFDPEAGGSTFL
jgi:hypothetical protein